MRISNNDTDDMASLAGGYCSIIIRALHATISLKYIHRHALKNISEALEQLPSSKDISEAHRVF